MINYYIIYFALRSASGDRSGQSSGPITVSSWTGCTMGSLQ